MEFDFQTGHVVPGDEIMYEEGCIPGNGIRHEDESFISTVHGNVERINKLVMVKPIRSRYTGNVGDVVIGRIKSIANGFWKVDINSKMNATLQLSSVNLPDGIQRRRNENDAMNMKQYLDVNDLICAEIQSITGTSNVQLHTRNERYGKLTEGILLEVHPSLIKRCKSHINMFDDGIKFICGMNGYIFISLSQNTHHSMTSFERVARVANCVRILEEKSMFINGFLIEKLYRLTIYLGIPVSEMLLKKNKEIILSKFIEEKS